MTKKHLFGRTVLGGLLVGTMLLSGCGKQPAADASSPEGSAPEANEGAGEVTTVRWVTAGTPQTGKEAVMQEVNRLLGER